LKKEGVLPAALKFQVCLPLTYSAVTSFFPDPEDHGRNVPGFTAALRAEVAKMSDLIPPDDLAFQWDLAVENRYIEATLDREGIAAAQREAERLMIPARGLSPHIPEQVTLGYHSCFGTLNGWPSRQPRDLTGSVILLNAAAASSGRRVDFVHLPTLGSAEDAFFMPLQDLDVGGAKIYLGAIHHMHGASGLRRQLQAARRYLPQFGVAAPCGFGRVPERPDRFLTKEGSEVPPDYLEIILRNHVAAVEQLRELMKD